MEEQLRYILALVRDSQKFAEAKNAALLATNTLIVLGIVQTLSSDHLPHFWFTVCCCYVAAMSIVSSVINLSSFLPQTNIPPLHWLNSPGQKTKSKQEQITDEDNLLFFEHIQKHSDSSYLRALQRLEGKVTAPSRMEIMYAQQIIVNSRITSRKFAYFRYALWSLICGVATPLVASILYRYFSKKFARE
jgi:hypothetical protein